MKITLQSISLHNFAGIRDLTLDFGGGNATVSGKNGAGKTTVIDAFLWLLFDKNSAGQSDFAIKAQDKDGAAIHNLEHEVAAALAVDEKTVVLRKQLREKWEKPRGKAQQEFKGHETAYWIDDEPYKLKDYKAYIDGLISEDLFRLLTDPKRFNDDAQIKPDERRKILLDMCGDISPDAVISSNKGLSGLPGILGDHSAESMRKIIAEKRRKINDELEKIPAQIEALTRTIPTLREDYNYGAVKAELDKRVKTVAALDAEATEASRALDAVRAQAAGLSKLELERDALARKLEADSRKEYNDALGELAALEAERVAVRRRVESLNDDHTETTAALLREKETLETIRAEYDKAAADSFRTCLASCQKTKEVIK